MEAAAEPFANDLIFLFMGGFFLAVAIKRWSLYRRTNAVFAGAADEMLGVEIGFLD